MRSVLSAIKRSKKLKLQIVVTGMHLDRRHGRSIGRVGEEGWKIDAVAPWKGESSGEATGNAIAALTRIFEKLKSDVVLLVGDRVEAFAAAAAGHLAGLFVAHIHGGDRALGQVDDSLRHAITKLSHIHFPATEQSARRIARLGEDRRRIFRVGSPGIEGIAKSAASRRELIAEFGDLPARRFALLVLHPIDGDESKEFRRADLLLRGVLQSGIPRVVVIYPNNDPGGGGIIRRWEAAASNPHVIVRRDVSRRVFLGLLRDAAFLAGNSSAGIIEAASFGTPVIDVGPRQKGRQRCEDVRNVPYGQPLVRAEARKIWNAGRPRRGSAANVYEGNHTGARIAAVLSRLTGGQKPRQKLITY
jgi:UDP-N-acetylglucosamine 2-epimerase (non-hydrolysing)/GDP/UDP-N,N'-diacetylbacillosamine 2-epimerase (hydrolysing)